MNKDEFITQVKKNLCKLPGFKDVCFDVNQFYIKFKEYIIHFYPLSNDLIFNKNFSTECVGINNRPLTTAEQKQRDLIIKLVEFLYFKYGGLQWDKSVPELDWEKLTSLSDREFKQVKNIKEVFEVNRRNKDCIKFFLRINRTCNQQCIFCPIDNSKKENVKISYLNKLIDRINSVYPHVKKEFIVSGGEPLLHPNYIDLINYIINDKKSSVTIQTNASLLAKPGFYKPFLKSKQVNYFISFHSHRKDIYDLLSNTKNQYGKAIQGITNILKNTQNWVTINCVINKYNFSHIEEYIKFIEEEFAKIRPLSIYLSALSLNKQGRDDYLIKFSKVVPQLVGILERNKNKNLRFSGFQGVCGFPLCFLQQYPKYFHQNENEEIEGREKPGICLKCLYRQNCPGLIQEYLNKFGTKEIKPITVKFV